MQVAQSKVRIIVGPNGSGKSTIAYYLRNNLKLNFGYFINADMIQKWFNESKSISNEFNITQNEANTFFKKHSLNKKFDLLPLTKKLIFHENINCVSISINSYEAAAIADLFRVTALKNKINFTYESVFSDKNKIDFVKQLKKYNYKIYIYVVCTLNPEINKSRVKRRVLNNGHSVPEEKIESRYFKSLKNIKKIIPLSNRTFIIDNSQEGLPTLIAEIENGKKQIFINKTYQPNWVKEII